MEKTHPRHAPPAPSPGIASAARSFYQKGRYCHWDIRLYKRGQSQKFVITLTGNENIALESHSLCNVGRVLGIAL